MLNIQLLSNHHISMSHPKALSKQMQHDGERIQQTERICYGNTLAKSNGHSSKLPVL